MAFTVRRSQYFDTTVEDEPGEAYQLLSQFTQLGVNLLAFSAVPMGSHTQLTIVPDNVAQFVTATKEAGITVAGPHAALLVQGDDELGALAGIHMRLFEANVNVSAATCVVDGVGSFGYVIYVRSDDYERAAKTLGA